MPDMNLPGQPPPPLFFPPFPNEEKMRRGRLNAEAPLGPLGETHSVGRRKLIISSHLVIISNQLAAPTMSPKTEQPLPVQPLGHGAHPYRHDMRAPGPQPHFFDLDLDLNPDL
jgi:mediator of RNA polymerase II transcription subunit 4